MFFVLFISAIFFSIAIHDYGTIPIGSSLCKLFGFVLLSSGIYSFLDGYDTSIMLSIGLVLFFIGLKDTK